MPLSCAYADCRRMRATRSPSRPAASSQLTALASANLGSSAGGLHLSLIVRTLAKPKVGLAHDVKQMRFPTREGIAFLRQVLVLIVARADTLPAACYLILDALTQLARNAELSHTGCCAVSKIVQPKVVDAVLSNYVAHAMRQCCRVNMETIAKKLSCIWRKRDGVRELVLSPSRELSWN